MTVRQRVRFRFSKEGDLRLISHRDLLRTWERLLRRAALCLSMTEGFHPKPRMSFPAALALGVAGIDEVVEVEFARPYTVDELRAATAVHLPPGMTLHAIDVLPPGAAKAQVRSITLEIPVPAPRREAVLRRIEALLAAESYAIERPGRPEPIDLRPSLERLELADGVLRARLRVSRQADPRPRELLAALDLADLEEQGLYLTRTAVEIDPPRGETPCASPVAQLAAQVVVDADTKEDL